MGEQKVVEYKGPAGGWGALRGVGKALLKQDIPLKGAMTLLSANQPDGFDCPGCAWPDRNHASTFEFCENGAKAVAAEATARRTTAGAQCAAAHRLYRCRSAAARHRRGPHADARSHPTLGPHCTGCDPTTGD